MVPPVPHREGGKSLPQATVLIAESERALQELWRQQLGLWGMNLRFIPNPQTIWKGPELAFVSWLIMDAAEGFAHVPRVLASSATLQIILLSWDREICEFSPPIPRVHIYPKSCLKNLQVFANLFFVPSHFAQ